jgi:carbon starvation protein
MPAYKAIWPLFGSTNQLLAGLTLVSLTLWLANSGKPRLLQWLVGIPMLFMMAMTITALSFQIAGANDAVMRTIAVVLLGLALWITGEALLALLQRRRPLQHAH